jgi:rod shape-determining protein MreD
MEMLRVPMPSPRNQLPSRGSPHPSRLSNRLLPRINLNNVPITYTSNEQIEVYRFSVPAAILIPLTALFLQAFIPLRLHFFSIFDLPLLVVIFFAVARRSQVAGLLTGAAIGLLQDSLTHQPIGVYGIAKTVVGYGASSLGVKLDVENAGSRFLVTLFFCVVHEFVYFLIARGLVRLTLEWSWAHELGSALANALLAVGLFMFLDRFKQRT